MMEEYNYGNGNDSDGNVAGSAGLRAGNGGHQHWPTSSADIVEYDSSVAADTPTLQQQHTQFLLPQQQQQRLRTSNFSQKPGAAVPANAGYTGRSAITSAAATEDAANGGHKRSKWKTRALYVFLACLLAVVVVNLTLTLWFIRVTQFTSVIIIILSFIIVNDDARSLGSQPEFVILHFPPGGAHYFTVNSDLL